MQHLRWCLVLFGLASTLGQTPYNCPVTFKHDQGPTSAQTYGNGKREEFPTAYHCCFCTKITTAANPECVNDATKSTCIGKDSYFTKVDGYCQPYAYKDFVNDNNLVPAAGCYNKRKTGQTISGYYLIACPPNSYIKINPNYFFRYAHPEVADFVTGYAWGCQCSAGYYYGENGATVCNACTKGNYCANANQQSPVACPTGTANPSEAQTSCPGCAVGKYADVTGLENCKNCPAGTKQSTTGQSGCSNCLAGTYSPEGAASCTSCLAGSYSAEGAAGCTLCARGAIAATTGLATCTLCIAGKYTSLEGQSSCVSCGKGYYSTGTGLSTCEFCLAGKFTSVEARTTCGNCATGAYSSRNASTICTGCAAGTFASAQGLSVCKTCDIGKYALTTKSVCSTCTNSLLSYQYYSTFGTTATGCVAAICNNALPYQYYNSTVGAIQRVTISSCSVASCTNAGNNQFYSGTGGQVPWNFPTNCTVSLCTNANATQYYPGPSDPVTRTSPTSCPVAACTNAKNYEYYSGIGGSAAPVANTCPTSNCTNQRLPGYYFSSPGVVSPTSCQSLTCTNPRLNNQYYSGHGEDNPTGCPVSPCTNLLTQGQFYSAPSFSNPTGCNISACTNKPPNSQYPLYWLNLNSSCAYLCDPGYYQNTTTRNCSACPTSTFNPLPGAVGLTGCLACTPGLHYPETFADLDTTVNARTSCQWSCRPGYRPADDGSLNCVLTTTTNLTELHVQNFAIVADLVNSTHTRIARLNFSYETTETLATVPGVLRSISVHPSGTSCYALDSAKPTAIFTFPISKSPAPTLSALVGSPSSAGNQDGNFPSARFTSLTHIAAPLSAAFLLAVDQPGTFIRKVDLSTSTVSTLSSFVSAITISSLACAPDGSYAVFSYMSVVYQFNTATGATANLAGGAEGFQDGTGNSAQFRNIVSMAVSPDSATIFVIHRPTASDTGEGVLRRISVSSREVTTPLRSTRLASGALSIGLQAANSIWALSSVTYTVIQLNATTYSTITAWGVAGNGTADDLFNGPTHAEKFASPLSLSVWACNRPGYACSPTDPFYALFAMACNTGETSNGVSGCSPCQPGTIAPAYASPACLPCNFPTYTTQTGAVACKACQADCAPQYRSGCGGASPGACQLCQSCPAAQRRTQCANFSSGTCEPCPNLPLPHQYYVPNPECGVSGCTNPLPAGNFWSLTGWTSATNCSSSPCANKPANSTYIAYNNLNSACKYACDPGFTGTACQPCAQGFYAAFQDSPQCNPCAPGTFSPTQAATVCQPCTPGTYQSNANASSCLTCPEGTSTPYQQSQVCNPCQPGYVAPPGSTACTLCSPGTFASPLNATHCQPCPPGTDAPLWGLTACRPCEAGYVAQQASAICQQCPPGTYANESCLPCPTGFYSGQGQTACDTCDAGEFATSPAGPCSSCIQGQYSLRSSTSCTPCPVYTYSPIPTNSCYVCAVEVDYPLNAFLFNTTGNSACDYQCNVGYFLLTTSQTTTCTPLDTSKPTFTFAAYVPRSNLSVSEIQGYDEIFTIALGASSDFVAVSFRSNTLQVVVQADNQASAYLFAGQVGTSAFQNRINSGIQTKSLPSAIVKADTLEYLFGYVPPPPPDTPSPPSPTSPSPAPPSNSPRFSHGRRETPPDPCVQCLAVFMVLYIIFKRL